MAHSIFFDLGEFSHLIFHGLGCVMLLQLTICKECCVSLIAFD
uniref:Uncharacterized protein n=1 Tax=Populus trichocarpa TaxID=3694 RepID=A0A3N7G336_POPTR